MVQFSEYIQMVTLTNLLQITIVILNMTIGASKFFLTMLDMQTVCCIIVCESSFHQGLFVSNDINKTKYNRSDLDLQMA